MGLSSLLSPTQPSSTNQKSGGPKEPEPSNPRETIHQDFQNEQPLWRLSCYGHRREGPCDLTGDVSFEEARYKFYSDRAHGVPDYKLVEEFNSAVAAKERELRALKKAADTHQRLPSMGGAVIREANAWMDQVIGRTSTPSGPSSSSGVVFGSALSSAKQPSSVFGKGPPSQPSPLPAFQTSPQQSSLSVFPQPQGQGSSFGSTFPASSAFPPPPASPFGSSPSFAQPPPSSFFGLGQPPLPVPAAFGGTPLAPSPSSFGSAPPSDPSKVVWGSAVGAKPSAFGSHSSTNPSFPLTSNSFGAPSSNSPFGQSNVPSAFGGQTTSNPFGGQTTSNPFGGQTSFASTSASPSTLFGAQATFSSPSSQQPDSSTSNLSQVVSDGHLEAFRAKSFIRGQIPDDPPPPELCR